LRGTRSAATFLGNCAKFHRPLARPLWAKKNARPALNLQDRPGVRYAGS